MKQWINEYLLSKLGVQKDYQKEWQVYRYLLHEKMFAMHGGDKNGTEILTLKLTPEHGEEVRELFPETVIPGYYMNKRHWNSVYLDKDFPDDLLKKMIDESHELIFSSLTKRVQKEILEQ